MKTLDFGVAKLLGESQGQVTQTGQVMGTVLYMSPEQLAGEPVDARSDLWSVGVLAYEMLAGLSPFQAESSAASAARILHDEPTSLGTVSSVPDWLVLLVSELLRKNPVQRPQTASEVLARLDGSTPASDGMRKSHIFVRQRPMPQPNQGRDWFSELKRRRVFRALVGYGIAAFAVLQIIEPIMHGLHWPEAALRTSSSHSPRAFPSSSPSRGSSM